MFKFLLQNLFFLGLMSFCCDVYADQDENKPEKGKFFINKDNIQLKVKAAIVSCVSKNVGNYGGDGNKSSYVYNSKALNINSISMENDLTLDLKNSFIGIGCKKYSIDQEKNMKTMMLGIDMNINFNAESGKDRAVYNLYNPAFNNISANIRCSHVGLRFGYDRSNFAHCETFPPTSDVSYSVPGINNTKNVFLTFAILSNFDSNRYKEFSVSFEKGADDISFIMLAMNHSIYDNSKENTMGAMSKIKKYFYTVARTKGPKGVDNSDLVAELCDFNGFGGVNDARKFYYNRTDIFSSEMQKYLNEDRLVIPEIIVSYKSKNKKGGYFGLSVLIKTFNTNKQDNKEKSGATDKNKKAYLGIGFSIGSVMVGNVLVNRMNFISGLGLGRHISDFSGSGAFICPTITTDTTTSGKSHSSTDDTDGDIKYDIFRMIQFGAYESLSIIIKKSNKLAITTAVGGALSLNPTVEALSLGSLLVLHEQAENFAKRKASGALPQMPIMLTYGWSIGLSCNITKQVTCGFNVTFAKVLLSGFYVTSISKKAKASGTAHHAKMLRLSFGITLFPFNA